HLSGILHAKVIAMQPTALTEVVRHNVEQVVVPVLRFLRRAVERRDHDRLSASALAKHRNVLLSRSIRLHRSNLLQPPSPDGDPVSVRLHRVKPPPAIQNCNRATTIDSAMPFPSQAP